jgi:hypothetical protein
VRQNTRRDNRQGVLRDMDRHQPSMALLLYKPYVYSHKGSKKVTDVVKNNGICHVNGMYFILHYDEWCVNKRRCNTAQLLPPLSCFLSRTVVT